MVFCYKKLIKNKLWTFELSQGETMGGGGGADESILQQNISNRGHGFFYNGQQILKGAKNTYDFLSV